MKSVKLEKYINASEIYMTRYYFSVFSIEASEQADFLISLLVWICLLYVNRFPFSFILCVKGSRNLSYDCAAVDLCESERLTSRCPLKVAWCRGVRPARSDTLTLLSNGTKASAQRTALWAADTCNGVCQFLSRALTSAECFNNTWTASWTHNENINKPENLCLFLFVVPWTCRTSLQEATARWRGVSHLLSLAFTLAPERKDMQNELQLLMSQLKQDICSFL